MRNLVVAAAASAALLTGAFTLNGNYVSASADELSTLSERQLHSLFPGEFHVVTHGLLKLHIIASSDGTLLAHQVGKSDTGQWEVRADRLCIKFSNWLKGRTRCSRVSENAGWYSTTDVVFKKSKGTALGMAE
jgi:hypothetical protein